MNHFDDKAATWDDEAKTARARAVAHTIRGAVKLDSSTRLLEYGAGTGLVAQFLADDNDGGSVGRGAAVGSVTLADTSAGMRAAAQRKAENGVLPVATRIRDLDLETIDAPGETFDLIVTVLVLHHIPNVAAVLERFAAMLATGGKLCIVDLEQEDGSFHADPDKPADATNPAGHEHHDGPAHDGPAHDGPAHDGPAHDGPAHDGPAHDGPAHDGFDGEELAAMLVDAGFFPTITNDIYRVAKGNRDYPLFLAVGTRR